MPAIFMFTMSNWALVIDVINGWVKGKGNAAIPWVSLILIILSIFVALETISALISRKLEHGGAEGLAE